MGHLPHVRRMPLQLAAEQPGAGVRVDDRCGRRPIAHVFDRYAHDCEQPAQRQRYEPGDNYIGSTVSAIQASSDWPSTAIFITYDDCGCFYDHVNPLQFNSTWGIRVPMVIVSPFVKLGYTDSTPTTFAGTLAFVEHSFGLPALNSIDGNAYDYRNAFCFQPAVTGCVAAGVLPITP